MSRLVLIAAAAVLAAGAVQAQRLEVDPTRASNAPNPIPTRPGELIASELSEIDAASGVERSAEWFVFTGRAGEVITAQVRSDIPTLEVLIRSNRGYTSKVLVEGPARDAPLRLVLPRDDTYAMAVHSKGPQRFGKYLLSLGLGDNVPPFEPPKPAPVQVAQAPELLVAEIGGTIKRPASGPGPSVEVFQVQGAVGARLTADVTGAGPFTATLYTPEGVAMLSARGTDGVKLIAFLPMDAVYKLNIAREDGARPYRLAVASEAPADIMTANSRHMIGYEVDNAGTRSRVRRCWIEPGVKVRVLGVDPEMTVTDLGKGVSRTEYLEKGQPRELVATRRVEGGELVINIAGDKTTYRGKLLQPPRNPVYKGYFCEPPPATTQVAQAPAPAPPVAPPAPPVARPTTPTPFESPKAWGMFAEVAKLGGLIPSPSKASFAEASMENGSPFIWKIYKVASDGLLYRLEFTPNAADDLRAWRGQVTPEGGVLWSPLHGFYDRGRTKRDDLLAGAVQRTRVFNQNGSTWGPWDNKIALYRDLLSEDGVLAVQRQLANWEPRFDATMAEIERQGIATDGADDARWARQRALRESNARTSAALNAMGSALSNAQAAASASEARSSAALQATLEEARRRQSVDSAPRAGQAAPADAPPSRQQSSPKIAGTASPGIGSAGPAERPGQPSGAPNRPAGGQPLRFMLELGLRNPINGVNGVCFSDVITVAGPAGWPVEGESTRAAMALVEPYRTRMRQACAEKAALQDSAPANIIWNSRGRETTPEDSVARWRSMKQLEIRLP